MQTLKRLVFTSTRDASTCASKRKQSWGMIQQPRSQGPLLLVLSRSWGREGEDHRNQVDDPRENEIRCKHKHEQYHPKLHHFGKLFRCEVIRIQCSLLLRITTCATILVFVILLRGISFSLVAPQTQAHAQPQEKGKQIDPCAWACFCAYTCIKLFFQRWNQNHHDSHQPLFYQIAKIERCVEYASIATCEYH